MSLSISRPFIPKHFLDPLDIDLKFGIDLDQDTITDFAILVIKMAEAFKWDYPDKVDFNDESHEKFDTQFSYHYGFTEMNPSLLTKARFEQMGPLSNEVVIIYIIPNQDNRGGVWLRETQNDEGVFFSLICVLDVEDHISVGRLSSRSSAKLIQNLKDSGLNVPSIETLQKKSYTTHKLKFQSADGEVKCQFCVSDMGEGNYYQHASFKFDSQKISPDLSSEKAKKLKEMLNLRQGRSSVLECLRLYFPAEYNQITKLDYEGDLLDCYSKFNYFAQEEAENESSEPQNNEEEEEEDDDEGYSPYDVFYPPKTDWKLLKSIPEMERSLMNRVNK